MKWKAKLQAETFKEETNQELKKPIEEDSELDEAEIMRLAAKHWENKWKKVEDTEEQFINPLNKLSDSEPEDE